MRYNADSVDKSIDAAYRNTKSKPSKSQRRVIHALLKGSRRDQT